MRTKSPTRGTSTRRRCASAASLWLKPCTPRRPVRTSSPPEEDAMRLLKTAIIVMGALSGPSYAQAPVRIGVMNDMSSVYADYQGRGSVLAAQMAAEDFGGTVAGRKIEIVSADHQNK